MYVDLESQGNSTDSGASREFHHLFPTCERGTGPKENTTGSDKEADGSDKEAGGSDKEAGGSGRAGEAALGSAWNSVSPLCKGS